MTDIDLVPDVLVVGAGVAGVMAAIGAQSQGARVLLLHRPGGGTPLSSGAIDVADALVDRVPGPAFEPLARGAPIRDALEWVSARLPRHPYARLGAGAGERLGEALALLRQTAASASLVGRDDGHNHVLATQLGTVKRTALAQKSQVLDLAALADDTVVGVVEPLDLAGFSARPVAEMLSWIVGLGKKRLRFVPVEVERIRDADSLFATPADMARHLDDEPTRVAFLDALATAIRQGPPPDVLLLPPVLGAERHAVVHSEAEEAAGRPVRELLASVPSAPGERLQRALLAGARERGITVVEAAAVGASAKGGRAVSVAVEGAGLVGEVRPKAIVLAGGRFLGGGVIRNGEAREGLFGLPIVSGGALVGDRFIGDQLGATVEADHAIFRAGIATDDEQRPLDASQRTAFSNVVGAGSLVEGWDPARDGTGAGVSMLTGLWAGERAARLARG